jgi:hypothetical protein
MIETLKEILAAIILAGGIGRFIDFLIGKAGQQKAKDLLLKWWVRFDDVRWTNFGREEGLYAGQVIERWFGRRIWCFRRIRAAFVLFIVFLLIGSVVSLMSSKPFIMCRLCDETLSVAIIELIVFLLAFCISVSLTRFITFQMAELCRIGEVRNLTIFVAMAIINYVILVYWAPITGSLRGAFITYLNASQIIFEPDVRLIPYLYFSLGLLKDTIIGTIEQGVTHIPFYPKIVVDYLRSSDPVDLFSLYCLSLFPNVFRFALSIIFVGSFLLKPVVMRPVNLVWRRVVESDKPVFTVMFGGAAAFATAISEAAKHLSG